VGAAALDPAGLDLAAVPDPAGPDPADLDPADPDLAVVLRDPAAASGRALDAFARGVRASVRDIDSVDRC